MANTERIFHPDVQKKKEERPPVASLWTDLSESLEMQWMRNENSPELSRREVMGFLFEATGIAAVIALGGWISAKGQGEPDVFPDGANHNRYEAGGYNEREAKASLPTPVPNPTPEGEK